ncbi:MAG TPA: imidazole glycerol phosphate synthase subunit HisH [Polyangiaceae bacterium]|nr:imidazole glycerol phosphate synthase subunit HisH [Polyangiaceae bacterium]
MSELTVIVDIGIGNLRSVEKALDTAAREQGLDATIRRSSDPEELRRAARVVMPGQSGFRDCALALEQSGLREVLLAKIREGTPYLGICLGLQLLFEESDEAPGVAGLGFFRGRVARLEPAPGIKIPHMGWNQLELGNGGHPCLDAAGGQGTWVYFVHSYSAQPSDTSLLKATAGYGPNQVTAAIARDNVLATQFHPEKSQRAGLALLGAFLKS